MKSKHNKLICKSRASTPQQQSLCTPGPGHRHEQVAGLLGPTHVGEKIADRQDCRTVFFHFGSCYALTKSVISSAKDWQISNCRLSPACGRGGHFIIIAIIIITIHHHQHHLHSSHSTRLSILDDIPRSPFSSTEVRLPSSADLYAALSGPRLCQRPHGQHPRPQLDLLRSMTLAFRPQ